MKSKNLFTKHTPTSGRVANPFTRSYNAVDLGTGGNGAPGGGVQLPPPIIFRAVLGKGGKPESR